jgi:hypothetical protein
MTTLSATQLTEMLEEAGQRHHEAFATANGADPEWPAWYAPYLQQRLWGHVDPLPTRSELIYLLIGAEREHRAASPDTAWAPFYAEFMLRRLYG